MRIECPFCGTSYTGERCGISDDLDVLFSIVCQVCHKQIDGSIETVPVPGKPASPLHRWTWGYLGIPGREPGSEKLVRIRLPL